jgi:polyisoprenoid-binding protein YceI
MSAWHIDLARSDIQFSVRHLMFARVRGRFDAWSGTIQLDEQDLLRSSTDVSIDAASINTGDAVRDGQVRSPDFLDVGKFPKIGFKSTRIEKTARAYRIVGELTIRDVTRQVVLEAKDRGRSRDPSGTERATFSATTSIDRRDFRLQWNPLLETGGVLVGDKVDIELAVQAVKPG